MSGPAAPPISLPGGAQVRAGSLGDTARTEPGRGRHGHEPTKRACKLGTLPSQWHGCNGHPGYSRPTTRSRCAKSLATPTERRDHPTGRERRIRRGCRRHNYDLSEAKVAARAPPGGVLREQGTMTDHRVRWEEGMVTVSLKNSSYQKPLVQSASRGVFCDGAEARGKARPEPKRSVRCGGKNRLQGVTVAHWPRAAARARFARGLL